MSKSWVNIDGHDKVVDESPRMGFETSFDLVSNTSALYARIAAVNKHGEIIGSTPAVELWSGKLIPLETPISQIKAPVGGFSNPFRYPPTVYKMANNAMAAPFLLVSGMAVGFAVYVSPS